MRIFPVKPQVQGAQPPSAIESGSSLVSSTPWNQGSVGQNACPCAWGLFSEQVYMHLQALGWTLPEGMATVELQVRLPAQTDVPALALI